MKKEIKEEEIRFWRCQPFEHEWEIWKGENCDFISRLLGKQQYIIFICKKCLEKAKIKR